MANLKPTEAELEILAILWQKGKATVREIYEHLHLKKPTLYTTTLKHVQIMFEKGMVSRRQAGKAHEYAAKLNREKLQKEMLLQLLDKVFAGSTKDLILKALEVKAMPPEDSKEIRKLLKPSDKPVKPASKLKNKKPKKDKKKEKPAKKSQAPQKTAG